MAPVSKDAAPETKAAEEKKPRLFVTYDELAGKATDSAAVKILKGAPAALYTSEIALNEEGKNVTTGNKLYGKEAIDHVKLKMEEAGALHGSRSFMIDETKIPKKMQAVYEEAMAESAARKIERDRLQNEARKKSRAEKAASEPAKEAKKAAEKPKEEAKKFPILFVTKSDINHALGKPVETKEGYAPKAPTEVALFLEGGMNAIRLAEYKAPEEGKKPQPTGKHWEGKKALEKVMEGFGKQTFKQIQIDPGKIPDSMEKLYAAALQKSITRQKTLIKQKEASRNSAGM